MEDVRRLRVQNPSGMTPQPQTDGLELVWGPVPLAEAQQVGAFSAACSLLLRVPIDHTLLQRVLALIPDDVIPRFDDCSTSLARRLGACTWLDDIHCKWKGKGPRYVRLNSSTYPQPRRVTWSVLVDQPFTDDDNDLVQVLFSYSQHARRVKDFRCRPMPQPVFQLGVELWKMARPFLGPYSRQHPPTACQLMLYYARLNSSIGRHRDNFNVHEAADALVMNQDVLGSSCGHSISKDGNSHAPLSDVLVFSLGDESMDVWLSWPSALTKDAVLARECYISHPKFRIPCGPGTLFIFSHLDDLHFCHEANFPPQVQDRPGGGYRMAFVFRWLTAERLFHVQHEHQFGRKLTAVEIQADLARAAEKRRSRKRRFR